MRSAPNTPKKARAKVDFEGKSYNLSSLLPIELSDDRATRKNAAVAKWGFYAENAEAMENIFDQMVKLRQSTA